MSAHFGNESLTKFLAPTALINIRLKRFINNKSRKEKLTEVSPESFFVLSASVSDNSSSSFSSIRVDNSICSVLFSSSISSTRRSSESYLDCSDWGKQKREITSGWFSHQEVYPYIRQIGIFHTLMFTTVTFQNKCESCSQLWTRVTFIHWY